MGNTKQRPYLAIPMVSIKEHNRMVKKLVKQGKRIGKTPWCCDIYIERDVYVQLNGLYNTGEEKYPQETMEETCNRRKLEKGRGINK